MKFKIRTLCAALAFAASANTASADDLLQIYQQALTNDPVVLQAKARRDQTFEAIEENRAPLLPTVSAQVGYNKGWQDPGNDTRGLSGTVNLNQVIYDHSAWVGLNLAEKAASQADTVYAASLQQLIIRVTTAYFNVLSAKDTFEYQQAEKRAIERQLEQTKQRFAVGLTAITDVHEAQAQYDLATAAVIAAQNDLTNSYEALREITGIDHKDLKVLDTQRFSASKPAPEMPNEWQKLAEDNNLSILSNRLAKDIAKETIKLREAGHLPSLSLNASYSKGLDRNIDGVSQPDLDDSSVGVMLSVPIFQGFSVTSQVKQAKYAFVEASQALEQTHREVVRSVRSNFNDVTASMSSIRAYEQSVISAESALKATQAGFEVGTRTIVDVLNSTYNLYNAKRQLSTARYSYINSILALKQAAGTLTEADVTNINNGLTEEVAPQS
ncbi:outer membrane channel protein TolC [Shewanella sp. A3A]|uniref:Outer membrane channel protein TolC n=1 Tax=Shewanella electrica TaxID=515560 RepID=A0ABT2FQW2_9GAMM|nr:outer membrane channel protein TolC [Shewanella electrica]MCH1920011.1 outer membrane channel protein TolC [Shewanella ferrihydritica]MCH1926050.1 outer membrane channel protein TolC [Shewanella electrica]MCS4557581.1 outer membrane channel protein TolC [Shewanella electrica]